MHAWGGFIDRIQIMMSTHACTLEALPQNIISSLMLGEKKAPVAKGSWDLPDGSVSVHLRHTGCQEQLSVAHLGSKTPPTLTLPIGVPLAHQRSLLASQQQLGQQQRM